MEYKMYTFYKTFQERLDEYERILCTSIGPIPARNVKGIWCKYIEVCIETVGWNALWKISKKTCKEFAIKFPTFVVVTVCEIDYNDLSAMVKVMAVYNDIHIPEQHCVNLSSLYPTMYQENDVMDIDCIAECLDHLRFFYNHLWQPWDNFDNEDEDDWPAYHLRPRITLLQLVQSDMKYRGTWDYMRSLLQQGRNIKEEIDDIIIDKNLNEADIDSDYTLLTLKSKLNQIQLKMSVLENPDTRPYLLNSIESAREKLKVDDEKLWVVWNGGSIENYIHVIDKLSTNYDPGTQLMCCISLQDALDFAPVERRIALCPGKYKCGEFVFLQKCCIMGCGDTNECIVEVSDGMNENIDWFGEVLEIENVTFNCDSALISVMIRHGFVRFSNCIFLGNEGDKNADQGLLILTGCRAEIVNCQFFGFRTAIVVNADASIKLSSCRISKCSTAIKVCDDANMFMEDVKLSKSEKCGIQVQCNRDITFTKRNGKIDILESFKNFMGNNVVIEDSLEEDVIVY